MDHMNKNNLLRELLNPQWERVMTVFEAWDEAGGGMGQGGVSNKF